MKVEKLRLIGNFTLSPDGYFGNGIVCGDIVSEAMQAEFNLELDPITGDYDAAVKLAHLFTVTAYNRGTTFDPCNLLARFRKEALAKKEEAIRAKIADVAKRRTAEVMATLDTFGYKKTEGLSEEMQPIQYKLCASDFIRVCTNKGDIVIDGTREAPDGEIFIQLMTELPLGQLIGIIALKN